ncbi:hypothetical protein V498_06321 [Pseudogymnoascus sp. VKM F-4517 (FW-2822)]|nr:hypothetical protein V498_06321 [Pseudogymnoascus sp. VKM F-4517 (FW-2822)]
MRARRQLPAHRPADRDIDEAALGVFVGSARGRGWRDEVRAPVAPGEGFADDLGGEGEVGGAGGAFEVVGAGVVEGIGLCWVGGWVGVVCFEGVVEGEGGGGRGWGSAGGGCGGAEA